MFGPNPNDPTPLPGLDQLIFLKNFITRSDIEVGDYTYYDDEDDASDFERRNVLYHYEFVGDKLIIGKFCSLAKDCTFMMNGANHTFTSFSTYPFAVFKNGWGDGDVDQLKSQTRGDTIVGNDVWIGRSATVMPGVEIGDGAIIGAHAIVGRNVPPYTIVAGNPAREIRKRFDEKAIVELQNIKWWDWPIEKITQNLEAITNADLDGLRNAV